MKTISILSAVTGLLVAASIVQAGSVCIQNDVSGDVLVLLKSSFKPGKGGAASGYPAYYVGGSSYVAYPITVGTVTSSGGYVGIGATQYAPSVATAGSVSSTLTVFHHIACVLGADRKISVNDPCTDIVTVLGGASAAPGHARHPLHRRGAHPVTVRRRHVGDRTGRRRVRQRGRNAIPPSERNAVACTPIVAPTNPRMAAGR